MELVFVAIKFITANYWRAGFICVALIACGLYAGLHIQGLRLREANIALQEEQAKTAKHITDGIVQDRQIAISANELASLRKQQVADRKKIAELLKNWPTECNEAVQAAVKILRERIK